MSVFKKNIKNILIALAISIVLIIFDQLTKYLAVKHLSDGSVVTFIKGIVNFRLTYNTGFAFGLGNGYQYIWAIVSVIGTIIIIYFMKDIDFKKNLIYTIAMILVLSGTIGNMIDRIFSTQGVVDFFDLAFMDFAVFNVADSYISVGAVFLCVYVIFIYKEPVEKKQEELKETNIEDKEND